LVFCTVLTIAELRGAMVALMNMPTGSTAYRASYVGGVVLFTLALGALIFFMARWALRTLRPSK
jgi:hypothetical protein